MKKLISVILSIILAFTMVSCSNNTGVSSDTDTEEHTNHSVSEIEENVSVVEITPNSYSTFVLDINSYDTYVAFTVPENWSVKKRDIKDGEYPQFLTLDESFIDVYDIFDENHNNWGAIGVAGYTENVGAKDKLMSVYGSVALPNMYNFILDEENYNAVKSSEKGETAVTKVYHSPSLVHNNGGLGEAVYGDGILSYNKECLVFAAVEYKEGLFNDVVLRTLADGIQIDWITGM